MDKGPVKTARWAKTGGVEGEIQRWSRTPEEASSRGDDHGKIGEDHGIFGWPLRLKYVRPIIASPTNIVDTPTDRPWFHAI